VSFRSVPGVRGKRAKREERKKRDIHRARASCEEESCDTAARILAARARSLFVLCELANRQWIISVFKIRSQYVANVCKA